ncbi:MAG: hypothetical protein EGP94_01870 [Lachnospiraceae bacterium]|nr:hypothetical protein [Lachnospiraceae bacterium]
MTQEMITCAEIIRDKGLPIILISRLDDSPLPCAFLFVFSPYSFIILCQTFLSIYLLHYEILFHFLTFYLHSQESYCKFYVKYTIFYPFIHDFLV